MATPGSRLIRGESVVVVETYGEVLMLPGGSVHRWNDKFKGALLRHTRAAAPKNKRPRWDHYGPKTLKESFRTTKTRAYKTKGGANIYAAVGSSAPYSVYVDQGTGVYGGGGPYKARILPPWTREGASLYEATWRPGILPGEPGPKKVAEVWIKGQRPQYFFPIGLERAFHTMRLVRGFANPYKVETTLNNPLLERAVNFSGNTENTPAFQASLDEWRLWRDEAWGAFKPLGRNAGLNRRLQGRLKERTTGGFSPADRRFLGLNEKQIRAVRRAEALEEARLRRRSASVERVRKKVERDSLAEERKRAAEDKEADRIRKDARRAKQKVAFDRAKEEANQYASAVERMLGVETSVRANKTRTFIRVSWTDGSGHAEHTDFAI